MWLLRFPDRDQKSNKFRFVLTVRKGWNAVPREIFDPDEFVAISERAHYCVIKRLRDVVKLKLRTSRVLYTLKVEPAKAEEIIKRLRCEVREV